MSDNKLITVAYGDGIGPEIMEAVLRILRYAKAKINIATIDVGKKFYERGCTSGIPDSAWESIKETKILLKAPITTPQGGGYKSLNVTLRKALGLYANIRPAVALAPFVTTNHPELDLVIIRENEEDLYTGIEYRQTHNMYQTLKLITKVGSERIIRYAFEYALKNNRKKVTCFSKDNIMKMTDGIFHRVFDEIALEYPSLENNHMIIDIGAAKLSNKPAMFDVIVTSNLYGDIISDVVAEISGSVGLAGSANIGDQYAMFEAVHGSAPDIAEQNIANPSGLLNAAIMMLVHIGQPEVAEKIHNAWLCALEDGMHTGDIWHEARSVKKCSTKEFAEEVIKRLGNAPLKMASVTYQAISAQTQVTRSFAIDVSETKQLVGVDVYVDYVSHDLDQLIATVESSNTADLQIQLIASKGLKIWPAGGLSDSFISDHYQLRFVPTNSSKHTDHHAIVKLLDKLQNNGLDFIKIENLYSFDDKLGFSVIS
jgi:isocitrate dehydrogenase